MNTSLTEIKVKIYVAPALSMDRVVVDSGICSDSTLENIIIPDEEIEW